MKYYVLLLCLFGIGAEAQEVDSGKVNFYFANHAPLQSNLSSCLNQYVKAVGMPSTKKLLEEAHVKNVFFSASNPYPLVNKKYPQVSQVFFYRSAAIEYNVGYDWQPPGINVGKTQEAWFVMVNSPTEDAVYTIHSVNHIDDKKLFNDAALKMNWDWSYTQGNYPIGVIRFYGCDSEKDQKTGVGTLSVIYGTKDGFHKGYSKTYTCAAPPNLGAIGLLELDKFKIPPATTFVNYIRNEEVIFGYQGDIIRTRTYRDLNIRAVATPDGKCVGPSPNSQVDSALTHIVKEEDNLRNAKSVEGKIEFVEPDYSGFLE